MSNDTKSGYHTDKTIQQVAEEWAESFSGETLALDMDDAEAVEDFDHYGIQTIATVEVTIAGGGPGADISFEFGPGGDFRHAKLNYYEFGGSASVPLSDEVADKLLWAWGVEDYRFPDYRGW